jgi:hypothetical protein
MIGGQLSPREGVSFRTIVGSGLRVYRVGSVADCFDVSFIKLFICS